jgi:hypothetical protein
MSELSNFERLAAINVNEQVEKKGGLSYLSWAWAVDRLLRADPEAEWHYGDNLTLPDGTMLVFCTVRAFGKSRTMQLPVMDYKNRAIANPDAFAINTAMQRALVKAIALHGLGLYIYAGEDLPPGEAKEEETKPDPARPNTATQVAVDAFDGMPASEQKELQDLATAVIDMVEGGDDAHGYLESKRLSIEHKLAIWSLFPSKVRTALKKAQADAARARQQFTPAELGSQP